MVKNLKKKKGFTLIELIIVIAILGILAAIAIPKLTNVQADAKIKADQANSKLIADATSFAISKGTIVVSSSKYVGTIDATPADYTTNPLILSSASEVKAELASVPTPKKTGSAFYVKIDANGQVFVYRDSAGTDTVYPQ